MCVEFCCFEQEQVQGHERTLLSVVTTVVMMTGTIEYVDNWLQPLQSDSLMYSTLSFVVLLLFLLLVPILLVNLLVSDVTPLYSSFYSKRSIFFVSLLV